MWRSRFSTISNKSQTRNHFIENQNFRRISQSWIFKNDVMCGFQLLQENLMKVQIIQHELKMAQSKSASFETFWSKWLLKMKSFNNMISYHWYAIYTVYLIGKFYKATFPFSYRINTLWITVYVNLSVQNLIGSVLFKSPTLTVHSLDKKGNCIEN